MSADTQKAPYFDDYNEEKNFQKILFKPAFPVQARELNQMQTIIEKQIERFGNKVLKQGTVVSGCDVIPTPKLAYVKLKNNETDGNVADVSRYIDKFVRNSANTVGKIVAAIPGYLDQAPDLNTIYVRYLTSGDDNQSYTFVADEVVTIYDPNAPVEGIQIVDGSTGFSNGDALHFLPVVSITNTAGDNTFSSGLNQGDTITDASGASVKIAEVFTENGKTFLKLAPIVADQLAGNTQAWDIREGATFVDSETTQAFIIDQVFGSGAIGILETNAIGEITGVSLTSPGEGYDYLPTVFASSSTASTTQIQTASFVAENFTAKIAVAGTAYQPIGVGFGLAIDKGQVYQSGYITRTDPQFVVVEKYNDQPSNKAVGFETTQTIVTALNDASLYDNALGTPNFTAPGADRLKVVSNAIVLTTDEAKSREDFLPIVEFSEGNPFQVSDKTESSLIDEHLAVRTYEENGNFVVDPFLLTTKSAAIEQSDEKFKIVVDPGVAYINGYRVATQRNYAQEVNKATETKTVTNTVSSTGYGNYVVATSLDGPFVAGSLVNLVDANSAVLGKAFLKGYKSVGTGGSRVFNIYLFDIKLNSGQTFKNVAKLVNNTFTATLQLVQGSAVIFSPNASRLVFNTPVEAVKSVESLAYVYQKSDWGNVTANTSGIATIVASETNERFPIAGELDADDKNQVLVSTTANTVSTVALPGTVAITAGNNQVIGTGTSFLSDLEAGRHVQLANTTSNVVVQVRSIANNTSFTAVAAPTITLASGTIKNAFVANKTITPKAVTVSGDQKTLTVDLGSSIPSTGVNITANVRREPTVSSKSVTRNVVARMNLSSHVESVTGPWALGHSDVIRLRGVYKGSNTTFTASQGTNVTDSFFVDANHTPDSKGTGYLYKRNTSNLQLAPTDRLLVVFDILKQSTAEVATFNSYPVDDTVSLSAASATINTLELPEIFGDRYVDVRDAFDFRPGYANTVAVHTTQSSAPVNPTEPAYGATRYSSIGRFPAPDSEITSTITYYLPRRDRVVASFTGDVKVLSGQAGAGKLPQEPEKAITINVLDVPPYPSLPVNLSPEMAEIAKLNIANENLVGRRNVRYTINATLTDSEMLDEQPRRFTQKDIGSLKRRIDAVEYYLALTAAEAQAASRFIGSGSTGVNRFKFGFLVDSFADNSQSEIDHPHYAASLDNGFVSSKFDRIAIQLNGGRNDSASNGMVSLPYTEQTVISQLLATDGPVVVAEPQPDTGNKPVTDPEVEPPVAEEVQPIYNPVDPVTEEVVTQSQTSQLIQNKNFATSITGSVSEVAHFHMSSLRGNCELYFNFRDNDNAIEIFQGDAPNFSLEGKTPIKDGRAAQRLSSFDQKNKAYGMGKLEVLNKNPEWLGNPPKPSREDAGKIFWTHEPENGRYYTIVVTKYRKDGGANNWRGRFYYRLFYPTDTVTTRTVAPFNGVVDFSGELSTDPKQFKVDYNYTNVTTVPVLPAQNFRVTVTGLKPLTSYGCLLEGEDYSENVTPVGKSLGDLLVSSEEGRLVFDLHAKEQSVGNKELIVFNEDGSAKASGIIESPKPPVDSSTPPSGYSENSGGGGGAVREMEQKFYAQ